jgi:hypothetical protein
MTVHRLKPKRRHNGFNTLSVVDGLTFAQCIEHLRDGRAYTFSNPNLTGYFYKAPFPEDPAQTRLDGACSAITYHDKATHEPATPTLMLYDFDDDEPDWSIAVASRHPRAQA